MRSLATAWTRTASWAARMRLGVPVGTVKRWLQPSLARRVLIVALTTFTLVWMVLVARDVQRLKDDRMHLDALQRAARILALELDRRPLAEALLIVQTSARQYNAMRHNSDAPPGLGDIQFQLERLPGPKLEWRSAGWTLDLPPLDDGNPNLRELGGHRHWAASQSSAAWRVTLLVPTLDDPRVPGWLASQLVEPLLISFPLVFIPLWLAVRQGLRPLRDLVELVRRRRPDDFSPLDLKLPHAELQPLEQAMEHLLSRARESIARERAMVHDAAHELRTPLAVMTAQAHALAQAPDDAGRQRAREALENAVLRASHLVHQLMTLARLEGTSPRPPQCTDVVAEARRILISASPLADRRHIEVALDSPDRLDASIDLVAFHSVLDNLLRNALDYGREHGQVLVTLANFGGVLHLTVADDGPGIAPEDQTRVFDRFHRGRDSGATSGAGLGLSIVRQAVRRLGGELCIVPGLHQRGIGFQASWPVPAPAPRI